MRRCENWIKSYINYTSFSEAPVRFHFWTAVSCLAAALRRKVYLDQSYFIWSPNFYIILVANPGIATKSTAMGVGQKIVSQFEDIIIGPNAMTWQALPQALQNCAQGVETIPGVYETHSCLSFFSSEFGTLVNPKNTELVDVLVDMWDGQANVWSKITKTSGDNAVSYPWINIIACTTPAWLQSNIPTTMLEGGFTSRCIFVYADEKRHLVAYPGLFQDQQQKKLYQDLLWDFARINAMKGEFRLTEEALRWGTKWYEGNYEKLRTEGSSMMFGNYWARRQTHLHKLAMVLSACRNDSLVIDVTHLQEAEQILVENEAFLPKIFGFMYSSSDQVGAHRLLDYIKSRKNVPRTTLYRTFMHQMTYQKFDEAINGLVQAETVRLVQKGDKIFIVLVEDKAS